jgi:mRNA interferase HigB
VRVVSEKTLKAWAVSHPDAETWLKAWLKAARRWNWSSLRDVRALYPHADGLMVASGRPVTVFNVSGNKYRLVTAIHYNHGVVYVLEFLSHAEYSKGQWKERL